MCAVVDDVRAPFIVFSGRLVGLSGVMGGGVKKLVLGWGWDGAFFFE